MIGKQWVDSDDDDDDDDDNHKWISFLLIWKQWLDLDDNDTNNNHGVIGACGLAEW